MAGEIPEFSADLPYCQPCGWQDADTEYVSASGNPGDLSRTLNPFGGRWPVFAFLKRTCLRCGFQWAEAPLTKHIENDRDRLYCDVFSIAGAQCLERMGHCAAGVPHRFPAERRRDH